MVQYGGIDAAIREAWEEAGRPETRSPMEAVRKVQAAADWGLVLAGVVVVVVGVMAVSVLLRVVTAVWR